MASKHPLNVSTLYFVRCLIVFAVALTVFIVRTWEVSVRLCCLIFQAGAYTVQQTLEERCPSTCPMVCWDAWCAWHTGAAGPQTSDVARTEITTHKPWLVRTTLRIGELRTQKLKSHLVRTQSLNVLPLKPGVSQYIAIHATLTARDFFLAYFYPSGPFTCIFSKTSPDIFLCWL